MLERFAEALRQPDMDKLRAQFSEKELGDLNMAVILINAWNRIAIPFQSMPGTYQPATRGTLPSKKSRG